MKIPHSCDYCINFCFNNYPYCQAKDEILDYRSDKQISAARKCDEYEPTPISWLTGKELTDKPKGIPEWLKL